MKLFRFLFIFHIFTDFYSLFLFCCFTTGGGGGGLGEPHQEERLHHCGHLPRPFQIHPGVSCVRQGLGDLRPFLLPDPAPTHEEGEDTGGVSSPTGPSGQTHTGNTAVPGEST